jgi:diphosphoinositol-polyphosphate diphosphatase
MSSSKRQIAVGCCIFGDQVVLVSSRKHPDEYILPKGGIEAGETPFEAAVRESWEEAGVLGVAKKSWGCDEKTRFNAHLVQIEVKETLDHWPEEQERNRLTVGRWPS